MKVLMLAIVLVGMAWAGDTASVAVVDTSSKAVTVPVKRVIVVPRPRTNWSKLKELFM